MCVLSHFSRVQLFAIPWTVPKARILEWVAMLFSRGSSQPRDQTYVSYVSLYCRQVLYPLSHLGRPRPTLHPGNIYYLSPQWHDPVWRFQVLFDSSISTRCPSTCSLWRPVIVPEAHNNQANPFLCSWKAWCLTSPWPWGCEMTDLFPQLTLSQRCWLLDNRSLFTPWLAHSGCSIVC